MEINSNEECERADERMGRAVRGCDVVCNLAVVSHYARLVSRRVASLDSEFALVLATHYCHFCGREECSMKNSTGDMVVDALIKMGKPLTVDNWISLNYWTRTRESLEGEELAELQRLIERGLLVDTESERVN